MLRQAQHDKDTTFCQPEPVEGFSSPTHFLAYFKISHVQDICQLPFDDKI